MAADHSKLKEKAKEEVRELTIVVVYLWLVLSSFAVQRSVILAQHGVDMVAYGFAAINALALGKVMLIALDLHFAQWWSDKKLIYATIAESAAFAVLLLVCKVLEDMAVDMFRGKTFAESLPDPAGPVVKEALALSFVLFIALLPFFAFMELRKQLGGRKIEEIFLRPRSDKPPA